MQVNERVTRQVILLSLFVLIISMIAYPERFGTGLARFSVAFILFELVFYTIALHLLNRSTSVLQSIQAAGLCFVYRLGLGVVFGFLLLLMYPLRFGPALTLALSSYVPGIILQILTIPFILNPVLKEVIFGNYDRRPAASPSPRSPAAAEHGSRATGSTRFGTARAETPGLAAAETTTHDSRVSHPQKVAESETNGFDRAARYIAEDASVQMAAVVDKEGLLLGNYYRGDIPTEDRAPLALVLLERNAEIVSRIGRAVPERVSLVFDDRRIIVAGDPTFCLLVMAERQIDDVLNIRITQGLDMIRKYIAERYSQELFANAENVYA